MNENSASGTIVATLLGSDPDAGNTPSYFIAEELDASLFEIVGDKIQVKAGAIIDYETNPIINWI